MGTTGLGGETQVTNYFIADMYEYESTTRIAEKKAKIHIDCKPCWGSGEYLGYDECPGCGLWVCENHDEEQICPTCVAEVKEEEE